MTMVFVTPTLFVPSPSWLFKSAMPKPKCRELSGSASSAALLAVSLVPVARRLAWRLKGACEAKDRAPCSR